MVDALEIGDVVCEDIPVTPRIVSENSSQVFSLSSPYVGVERIARLNHGVDPDSLEKHPLITLSVHPLDSNLLATGGHEGSVCLWRLKSGESFSAEPITTLVGHSGQVNAVRFSPDGSYLASGSSDSTIRVYSQRTSWSLSHSLRGHRLDVCDVAWFSPTVLLSCSADGRAIVWDASTGGKNQEVSLGACSPKGILVDPEYFAILFDAGLIDVYRHTTQSGFKLTRQVDLPKHDPKNFAKSTRTTLYPRRASWTPDGNFALFPLGMRGSRAAAVMYNRSTLLEPNPNETFASTHVLLGHPARVVLTTIKPVDMIETEKSGFMSVIVSVDGVLSVWSSVAPTYPLAVVSNLIGPFGVTTDAAWMGDTLLLASSDGAVTAVKFFNITNAPERIIARPKAAPYSDKPMQMETRTIGGKRKIQPIIVTSNLPKLGPIEAIFNGSSVVANNGKILLNGVLVDSTSAEITAVAHNDSFIAASVKENDEEYMIWVFDKKLFEKISFYSSEIIFIALSESSILSVISSTCVSLWRIDHDIISLLDAPLTGLFQTDLPVSVLRLTEEEEPVVTLKSGRLVRFNKKINRWTHHIE